jgi:hypothetical protein
MPTTLNKPEVTATTMAASNNSAFPRAALREAHVANNDVENDRRQYIKLLVSEPAPHRVHCGEFLMTMPGILYAGSA